MSMILDIIIIAIAAITVVASVKQGFVKSVAKIATAGLSFFVAYSFCGRLGQFIYDRFLIGSFTDNVSKTVNNLLVKTGEQYDIAKLFNDMPRAFVDLLSRFGIDVNSIASQYGDITSGTSETVYELSQNIASPIANVTAVAIAFVALFLASLLVFMLAFKLVDLLCKLPVLKTANRMLGGVVGIVLAVFYVWVFAAIAVVILGTLSATNDSLVFTNVLENSFLLKFFYEFNPIATFLGIN
jgi:uncharacterized membrane protein required for colicin V production